MNFLVEIRAAAQSGDQNGTVATGFAVGPNLILTARHAVVKDGCFAKQILARWPYLCPDWIDVESIAWPSSGSGAGAIPEKPDAALLTCKVPETARKYGIVSNRRPYSFDEFFGCGFADVAKQSDGRRGTVPMHGRVGPAPDAEDVPLATKASPKDVLDWRGASGAPVFRKNTWKIVGVVITCDPRMNANALKATPAWKLLELPEFAKLVRPTRDEDAWAKRFQEQRREASQKLRGSKNAFDALKDAGREFFEASPCDEPKLVNELQKLDAAVLAQTFRKSHDVLVRQGNPVGARVIRDVTCLIIPFVFDAVDISEVGESCGDREAAAVRLRVSDHTVAEFVMARLDGRSAKFRWPPRSKAPKLWGCLHLPPGPEIGAFEGKERFCATLREAAQSEFNITPTMVKDMLDRSSDPEARVRKRMHDDVIAGKTRYYIIDVAQKDYDGSDWPNIVRELKNIYPHLVFMRFERPDEVMDRDEEVFFTLLEVLTSGLGQY